MKGKTNASIMGGAGYENVNISVATNQSGHADIMGVEVTLTILQDGKTMKETWQGNDLLMRVPRGADYKVSFSEVADYRKPSDYTGKAEAGRSVSIDAKYETEVVTVSVSAENGASVAGQVITINGKTHTLDASGKATQKVAYGTQYTITASGKDSYFTPETITRTAQSPAYGASMYYALANETLTVNVSGLSSGFTITVKDDSGNTLGTSTSAKATFAIPNGTKYTVSASSVTGYNVSGGGTYTAVGGSSNTVNIAYTLKTYTLTVKVSGLSSGFSVSVVNGGTTTSQTATSKTYTVTHGASYSVTGGAVTGYNVSGNASGTMTGDLTVTVTYTAKTYTLTVNVSGLSSGFSLTVKYGSTTKTQTATSATYSVTHGQTWSVTGNDVVQTSGTYIASGNTSGTMTANKTVTITYTYRAGTKNPSNGVWIQDTEGYCHAVSSWTGEYSANCIVLVLSTVRFGIALNESSNEMDIHDDSQGALENYMSGISSESSARDDYDGATNTTNIMKLQSGTDYAAGWCNAYTFRSGKKGYLPACGEMYQTLRNKTKINEALSKVGGTIFDSRDYWTSTFRGKRSGDSNFRDCWYIHPSDGMDYQGLSASAYVRPFCAI